MDPRIHASDYPDPDIFVINLQVANKKLIFVSSFFAYYFWRYIYIIFQR